MAEKERLRQAYEMMYDCMIRKDMAGLYEMLDDSFVLIHMTGLQQKRHEFAASIRDGTLNYFTARHEAIDVRIHGDTADIDGKSFVSSAIYGGGRSCWRLRQKMKAEKKQGRWVFTHSTASTY